MYSRVQDYLSLLSFNFPKELYWVLIILFCAGCVFFMIYHGFDKGVRYTIRLVLAEYLLFLYCSTVFCRASMEEVHFNLVPFWGYTNYEGELRHLYVIMGNVMNIVAFLPVGILLPLAFERIKFKDVLLCGLGISLSIEVLQYVLKRGFLESDDLIHNTIGCIVGYGLFLVGKKIYEGISKRCVEV